MTSWPHVGHVTVGPPLRAALRFCFPAPSLFVDVLVHSCVGTLGTSAAVVFIANLRDGVYRGTHPSRLSSASLAVATRMRSDPAPEDLSARTMASCSS